MQLPGNRKQANDYIADIVTNAKELSDSLKKDSEEKTRAKITLSEQVQLGREQEKKLSEEIAAGQRVLTQAEATKKDLESPQTSPEALVRLKEILSSNAQLRQKQLLLDQKLKNISALKVKIQSLQVDSPELGNTLSADFPQEGKDEKYVAEVKRHLQKQLVAYVSKPIMIQKQLLYRIEMYQGAILSYLAWLQKTKKLPEMEKVAKAAGFESVSLLFVTYIKQITKQINFTQEEAKNTKNAVEAALNLTHEQNWKQNPLFKVIGVNPTYRKDKIIALMKCLVEPNATRMEAAVDKVLADEATKSKSEFSTYITSARIWPSQDSKIEDPMITKFSEELGKYIEGTESKLEYTLSQTVKENMLDKNQCRDLFSVVKDMREIDYPSDKHKQTLEDLGRLRSQIEAKDNSPPVSWQDLENFKTDDISVNALVKDAVASVKKEWSDKAAAERTRVAQLPAQIAANRVLLEAKKRECEVKDAKLYEATQTLQHQTKNYDELLLRVLQANVLVAVQRYIKDFKSGISRGGTGLTGLKYRGGKGKKTAVDLLQSILAKTNYAAACEVIKNTFGQDKSFTDGSSNASLVAALCDETRGLLTTKDLEELRKKAKNADILVRDFLNFVSPRKNQGIMDSKKANDQRSLVPLDQTHVSDCTSFHWKDMVPKVIKFNKTCPPGDSLGMEVAILGMEKVDEQVVMRSTAAFNIERALKNIGGVLTQEARSSHLVAAPAERRGSPRENPSRSSQLFGFQPHSHERKAGTAEPGTVPQLVATPPENKKNRQRPQPITTTQPSAGQLFSNRPSGKTKAGTNANQSNAGDSSPEEETPSPK